MTSSIFGIGLSGLAAAQAALVTTSHNIANVNTPNYSRQEVLLSNRTPYFAGSGYIGQGVSVESVRRVYDNFLVVQARQAQAASSHLDSYQTELGKLDNLLSDTTNGLSPTVDRFFASINTAASNPADPAARQVLLSSAQQLVSSFHQIDDQLNETRSNINQQVSAIVTSVNSTAQQIADLNQTIAVATARSGGAQPPNDLLDKRDALLADLNKQIGAVSVTQSDGTFNVYLSNGQALVVNQDVTKLAAIADPQDSRNIEVGVQAGGSVVRFTPKDLSGGALSGLLNARDSDLSNVQNSIGRIAAVLAKAFNDQHALGIDANGAAGGAFFAAPTTSVQDATTNTGNAGFAVALTDASALTTSDYRLKYDGANYSLTRLSDNTVSTFAALPQTVDGLTITLASGAPAAGDSFLIQPTRYAAGELDVALSDPSKVALAAPILTSIPTSNVGTGKISAGNVSSAYLASPLPGTVALTFNGGPGTLTGFPAAQPVTVTIGTTSTTYPAGSPVPYTANATISFGGITFTISGAPADGDTFDVSPNPSAIGDNRNALLLAGLATQKIAAGNSATVQGAYALLIGQVGSKTQQAQIENDAQAQLLSQAQAAQQQLSGVNLDEEAANLQRYQQAYMASSKVLAIANTLFDSILGIAAT